MDVGELLNYQVDILFSPSVSENSFVAHSLECI